jgi:DNA-binding PadR family transcriptional regulator
MEPRRRPQEIPAIKAPAFHILLALADGPRHGYAIRSWVEELTQGGVKLWPATLYGTVRQLNETGLIEPVAEPSADDDARRIYYGLTDLGRRALIAETERMRALVDYARSTRAMADAQASR